MTPEEMRRRLEAGEDPLDLSIQKWQDIVDGKGEEQGWKNCALCQVYSCEGCPIAEAGYVFCHGTPYETYCDARDRGATEAELKEIAKREIDFLKSLKRR